MLSIRLRLLLIRQYRGRLLHTTSPFNFSANAKDSLSPGHVTSHQSAQHDPFSQSARAGLDQNKSTGNKSSSHIDAASPNSVQKAPRAGKGNPEQVGFADQVGSASSSANAAKGARGGRKNGLEEVSSPGFFNALKKMFGFKTWSREVKPGGTGITGTETTPPDSTRYVGKGRANEKEMGTHITDVSPEASRMPKEKPLLGDQNEHLTHKKKGECDSGKGNAAEEPVLPSQRKERKEEGEDQAKRFPSGARG